MTHPSRTAPATDGQAVAAPTVAESHGPAGRALRYLPAVTLAAVVTVTSTSEWTLARTVLDLPPAVAWAVPVAIDSYVIAALRTRRDVGAAITVMAGALAAAMGAHLAAAEHPDGALPPEVTAPAAAAILSVLVIVAWRVHVLIDHLTHTDPHSPQPTRPSTSAPEGTGASTPAVEPPPSLHRPMAASTPSASTSSHGQPTGGRDEYTDLASAAAGVTGTGERGSSGAGGVAAAPRRTTDAPARTTVEVGRNGAGLTDEQILADLHATGDGTSPGIRALKRTYAIGQTRAARIHQQITDQEAEPSSSNNSQKNAEPSTKQNDDEDPAAQSQESEQEYPRIRDQESHPGITDRVGRPRSTKEWAPETPDADSPVLSEPISGSTSDGLLAGEH